MREKAQKVLEIGICGFRDIPNNVVGASLFAWRDYFPNAEIYGLDNDARFIFNDQHRIHTAQVDAYDYGALAGAIDGMNIRARDEFDFIVDDAVHDPGAAVEAPALPLALPQGERHLRHGGRVPVQVPQRGPVRHDRPPAAVRGGRGHYDAQVRAPAADHQALSLD
jgi:hypothetical protein